MEVNDIIDDGNLFAEIESIHLGGDDSSEINSNQNIFHDVLSEVSLKDEKHLSPSVSRSVPFQKFRYIALTPRSYLSSRITSPAVLTTVPQGIGALNLSLSDWDSPQSTVNLFSSKDAYPEYASSLAKDMTQSLISTPSSLTQENLRKHQKSLEQNEPISASNSISTIRLDQSSPTRKSGGNTNNSSVQRFILYEKVLSQLKSIKSGSQSTYSSFYHNPPTATEVTPSQQVFEIAAPTISASLSKSYDHTTVTHQEIIEDHYALPCNPDDISDSSQQNYSPTSPSSLIAGSEHDYLAKDFSLQETGLNTKNNKLFPYYMVPSELHENESVLQVQKGFMKEEENEEEETIPIIQNEIDQREAKEIENTVEGTEYLHEVQTHGDRISSKEQFTLNVVGYGEIMENNKYHCKDSIYSARENHISFFGFLKILSALTTLLIAYFTSHYQPITVGRELALIPRSYSAQTKTSNFSEYMYSKQDQSGFSKRSSFEPLTTEMEETEELDQYLKSLLSLYFTETSMKTVSVYLPQRT
eukprot:gene12381-13534_t